MHKLTLLKNGEHYYKIPCNWNDNRNEWNTLDETLDPVLYAESSIYIDLEDVEEISGEIFNLLFNLASRAGKARANLLFTNASESIEERISLLTNTSE